jgi:pimeloyl-ACP methyl ester carboxylesterase
MLGPDSQLLTALLIIVSVALLAGVIRFRLLPVKILCGALSIMVAMTGGIAAVNFYYGYYTTWGQMWADFHGGTGNLGVITPATSTTALGSGRLGWTNLPGQLSGYDRRGLVYLPPQYSQAKYARIRYPVVELFHGTPGTSPLSWDTRLRIGQVADSLLARNLIGPMVLVMPTINGPGHQFQDCVNGPAVNDETYLTKDVRTDVYAHYRVSQDPYEWGLAGYSSGGYCAANLALRHPGSFGAAAVINGYFRAADGPAGAVLNNSQPLEAANSPLYLAERLTPDSSPVPAFWVAAGTNDKTDYKPATMFAAAMDRIQQVPFVKLNAGDTANAWSASLPAALVWLWQQLAPPDLRVLFPVRSHATNLTTLPVPPVKPHLPGLCMFATRPGAAALPCGCPTRAAACPSRTSPAPSGSPPASGSPRSSG